MFAAATCRFTVMSQFLFKHISEKMNDSSSLAVDNQGANLFKLRCKRELHWITFKFERWTRFVELTIKRCVKGSHREVQSVDERTTEWSFKALIVYFNSVRLLTNAQTSRLRKHVVKQASKTNNSLSISRQWDRRSVTPRHRLKFPSKLFSLQIATD